STQGARPRAQIRRPSVRIREPYTLCHASPFSPWRARPAANVYSCDVRTGRLIYRSRTYSRGEASGTSVWTPSLRRLWGTTLGPRPRLFERGRRLQNREVREAPADDLQADGQAGRREPRRRRRRRLAGEVERIA